MGNLAASYRCQGRLDKAIAMEETLQILIKEDGGESYLMKCEYEMKYR